MSSPVLKPVPKRTTSIVGQKTPSTTTTTTSKETEKPTTSTTATGVKKKQEAEEKVEADDSKNNKPEEIDRSESQDDNNEQPPGSPPPTAAEADEAMKELLSRVDVVLRGGHKEEDAEYERAAAAGPDSAFIVRLDEHDEDLDLFLDHWVHSKSGVVRDHAQHLLVQQHTLDRLSSENDALRAELKKAHDRALAAEHKVDAMSRKLYQQQCCLYYGFSDKRVSLFPPATPPGATPPDPSNVSERVGYLESIVSTLQGLNRELYSKLEHERIRKHECAKCVHCVKQQENAMMLKMFENPIPSKRVAFSGVFGADGDAAAAAAGCVLPFSPESAMLSSTTRPSPERNPITCGAGGGGSSPMSAAARFQLNQRGAFNL
eukprot:PhM_4_TR2683/c0_g1_i1/m.12797